MSSDFSQSSTRSAVALASSGLRRAHSHTVATRQSLKAEGAEHGPVPHDVGVELALPVILAGRRVRGEAAALVAVPEAAVHEHGGLVLGQEQVRAPRQVLRVQAVAQAARVQRPTQRHLGLGVLAADRRHDPGARLAVNVVDHRPLFSRSFNAVTTMIRNCMFTEGFSERRYSELVELLSALYKLDKSVDIHQPALLLTCIGRLN